MQAIILAGGLGTRLRPLTDNTPKPLLPINGKPILEHVIENAQAHGVTDIILAISYHADQIKAYFGNGETKGIHITYSVEKTPLGTGGAIKQANGENAQPFILIWGDNLTDIDIAAMLKQHEETKATITMALTKREDVEHFGVAQLEGNKIIGFVEKPPRDQAPSNLINAGCFVVNPTVLSLLPEGVSNIERECFEKIVSERGMYAYIHEGQWFPTDTIEKYELAQEFQPRI